MPLNLLLRALPDLGYVSAKHIYETGDIRQKPGEPRARRHPDPSSSCSTSGGSTSSRSATELLARGAALSRPIVWRVITDRAAAAAQLEAGQLHYSPFSGLTISDMARLGKDKRFIVSNQGQRRQRAHQNARVQLPPQGTCRHPRAPCLCPRLEHSLLHRELPGRIRKRGTGPFRPYRRTSTPPTTARSTLTTRRSRTSSWTRRASSAAPTARASRCACCPRPGARTSLCSQPSSSRACRKWASRSRSCAMTAAAS